MHKLGYLYVGPANLYQVTFFEIMTLSEGQKILALVADGVTPGEEAELKRLSEELAT